jgi:hypothetical protein
VHSTSLLHLDFLGDLSIRFRGHRSRRGTRILPGLPTFVSGFPPNFRETEEIVLEVCKNEGLQQIIWISRLLSETEERDKVQAILAEGMCRYGEAEISEQGVVNWSAGRTVMARTLWVKSGGDDRIHTAVHVRFAPKADKPADILVSPLCAKT